VPVDAYATWCVHTAQPDENTTAVASRVLDLAVGRMPVVRGGKVIGMVSTQDLLAAEADTLTGGEDGPAERP
jgi:hypothetical protein